MGSNSVKEIVETKAFYAFYAKNIGYAFVIVIRPLL